MMVATKESRYKDLRQEHAKLLKEAMKLPGVADLMTVYRRLEPSYLAEQKYREAIEPTIFISDTDSFSQV